MSLIEKCPVCFGKEFFYKPVLWEELIRDWELKACEAEYINLQQGYTCNKCFSNLRSMALAKAIKSKFFFDGRFDDFMLSDSLQNLVIMEINEAGSLHKYFRTLPNHIFAAYPDFDMMNLKIGTETVDLLVHSDTLEHVEDPVVALKECLRVLVHGGSCIFTVPMVVGRRSRSRKGMKRSYHGNADTDSADYTVYTEFGCDVWMYLSEAGFEEVKIHKLISPSAFAFEGVKRSRND